MKVSAKMKTPKVFYRAMEYAPFTFREFLESSLLGAERREQAHAEFADRITP